MAEAYYVEIVLVGGVVHELVLKTREAAEELVKHFGVAMMTGELAVTLDEHDIAHAVYHTRHVVGVKIIASPTP